MKFYRIKPSLNTKIIGNYPQVKEVIHNCHVRDEPNFIDRFPFEKIEGILPIMSNPVLYAKSKQTDLIFVSEVGFSFGSLLISNKLKNILESYNFYGIQFFKNKLIQNNEVDNDYWQTHIFDDSNHLIDFSKSEINVRLQKQGGGTELVNVDISSQEEFNTKREYYKQLKSYLFIKKIALKNNIEESLFILRSIKGGLGYIVSEELKRNIELERCTGIEFQLI